MKRCRFRGTRARSWATLAAGLIVAGASAAGAELQGLPTSRQVEEPSGDRAAAFPVDLPTALRLAGANNLDVALAQERVKEARARHEQARLQYFPWLSPAVGYRGHRGNLQDIAGAVFEADKQSYTAGVGLTAQLNLGEAIYHSLAARQRARAAEEEAEARRRDAVFRAAAGYFELARAVGAVGAAAEAARIANDYAGQVRRAVEAGIAFQGDVFRTEVQWQKNLALVRQSEEQRRVAAARLAEILRLDPATDLMPVEATLVPLALGEAEAAVASLVDRAMADRPELRRSSRLASATEAEQKEAVRAPWVPTLGAQLFVGGLGGGPGDHLGGLGDTEDYALGLSWRVGPGGLFDRGRIRAAESRHQARLLELEEVRLAIQREVVEAWSRCRSLADQVAVMERSVAAAQQLLRLSQERKAFGVGAVLETIQAEQELTRTRLEYLLLVAQHNQAQYALRRAVGG